MAVRYLRSQTSVIVGAIAAILLSGNLRRKALLIGCQRGQLEGFTPNSNSVVGADSASTGVKLTYAGVAAQDTKVTFASARFTAGAAPTVALQYNDGTGTFDLVRGVAPQFWNGEIDLLSGTSLTWNVIAAGAASVTDFVIAGRNVNAPTRVTLSFGQAAVLDQGINLYAGGSPLLLTAEQIGDAIKEDIFAIANTSNQRVGLLDIFEA